MHASYRGLSYKSALDVWSSCVRLSLKVWTVEVVAVCKAFQVAREAVRIRKQILSQSLSFLIPVVTAEQFSHVTLRYQ